MRAFATLDSIPNRPFVLLSIRTYDGVTFLLICCPHKAVECLHDYWLRLHGLEEAMVVQLWALFCTPLFECREARTQRLQLFVLEINRRAVTRRKTDFVGDRLVGDLAWSAWRHGMLYGNIII